MINRKQHQKQKLIQQILVGGTTLIIGGGAALGLIFLVIKAFG